jgi:hypothetical protein
MQGVAEMNKGDRGGEEGTALVGDQGEEYGGTGDVSAAVFGHGRG